MQILVNDKPYEVAEGCTIAALIARMGLTPQGMAVAVDDEVVPKDRWDSRVLAEGQELVLIHAVSGG